MSKRNTPWGHVCLTSALALLLLASGCDLLGSRERPFAWAEVGNSLTYDYRAGTELIEDQGTGEEFAYVEDILELRIEHPEGKRGMLFESYGSPKGVTPKNFPAFILWGIETSFGFERGKDGLRSIRARSCSDGFLGRLTSHVIVPSRPRLNQRVHYYKCGDEVEYTYRIAAVDTTITVPAGTFETFAQVEEDQFPTHYYWSEAEGLIKIELFNQDGTLRGAYELASRNFGAAQ